MSKIIAAAGIRGAHQLVARAKEQLKAAIEKHGPDKDVAFPNTGYYLPVIYGILGIPVKKLGDMKGIVERCERLLPAPVRALVTDPQLPASAVDVPHGLTSSGARGRARQAARPRRRCPPASAPPPAASSPARGLSGGGASGCRPGVGYRAGPG